MSTERAIIGIYDGDLLVSSLLQEILDGEGYRTVLLANGSSTSFDPAAAEPADVIVADLSIERTALATTRHVIAELRRSVEPRRLPVLGLTADSGLLRRASSRLADLEHFALLPKPFALDALLDLVATLVAHARGHDGTVLAAGSNPDRVAVLYADGEGRYVDANEAALALLGYTREELVARRVADVMVSTPSGVSDQWVRYQRQRSWSGEDVTLRCKDGRPIRVRIHAAVLQGQAGSAVNVAWLRPTGTAA
jgi:PAS domain S-box-containing protein